MSNITRHGKSHRATAFQMSRDTGAFSGLAMGLTGLLTAFIAPWLLQIMLPMFF